MTRAGFPGTARASRALFGASPKSSPDLTLQASTSSFRKSSQSRGRDCKHARRVRSPIQLAPR
jgi:hypothetical protein